MKKTMIFKAQSHKLSKKVSVIIPTFNCGNTLRTCLDSVLNQTYQNYEIIIVDSFSTDSTRHIIEEYGIKHFTARGNQASARNIGVSNSKGTFILFLDSDQSIEKSVIQECVEICIREHVGMVKIPEVFVGIGLWSHFSATWKNYHAIIDKLYQSNASLLHGEPRFFLKKHLNAVGLINENLLWGENFNLYTKIRSLGVKEAWCKSKVYHYEPTSLKEIFRKNLSYGKSLTSFSYHTEMSAFRFIPRNAILALREALKDSSKSPLLFAGCLFIIYIKLCAMLIGIFTQLPRF